MLPVTSADAVWGLRAGSCWYLCRPDNIASLNQPPSKAALPAGAAAAAAAWAAVGVRTGPGPNKGAGGGGVTAKRGARSSRGAIGGCGQAWFLEAASAGGWDLCDGARGRRDRAGGANIT